MKKIYCDICEKNIVSGDEFFGLIKKRGGTEQLHIDICAECFDDIKKRRGLLVDEEDPDEPIDEPIEEPGDDTENPTGDESDDNPTENDDNPQENDKNEENNAENEQNATPEETEDDAEDPAAGEDDA